MLYCGDLRMQTSDPDKPSPERPLSRTRKFLHGVSPLNILPLFPLVGSIAMKGSGLVSKVHLCAHTHAFSAWADLVLVAFMLSLCVRDTSRLLHVQESSCTFQACMVQARGQA